MIELENFEREAYEALMTATIHNDSQAQAQALHKFIPGSDLHDYLYLVLQLN
jgi:DNA-binding SARP family transcriptional activator